MSISTDHQLIPAYLGEPVFTGHYYGELHYEKRTDSWIIKGEPIVCQMAKRIFPASSGRTKGEARFKRNKRTNGDLNWLMMKYPLKIMDEERWEQDKEESVRHVTKRIELNNNPQKVIPSDLYFKGELREFQKEGVAFLQHNAPCLLADDMGLGKTVEALAWIANLNRYPGVIVCPNNVVLQWAKQIKNFISADVSMSEETLFGKSDEGLVHIIRGLKPYELPPASFYIIHYGLLRGWKDVLPNMGMEFVVFDEIQELRHKGTEKYSSASLLAQSTDNVVGLSGTPIYNTGGEIWNVTNIIEYHCMGDWDSFTREWCYGYGNDIVSDPEMLGDFLRREGLMLRRTKDEVLDELPKKRRVVHEIDHDETEFTKAISEAMSLLEKLDTTTDHLEKGRLRRRIGQEARQATGIAKAPYVASFVKMLLEAGERIVLYGYHHAVYDIWLSELKKFNPVKVTGDETQMEKDANVQKFINKESNLIIISLRASAGLDGLQNGANLCVFGELDWSPSIHSQCEDRLHRLGQRDSVLCYYLVSSTGTDDVMQETLGLKTAQILGIMGGNDESEEDKMLAQVEVQKHMDNVLDKLRKRN